MRFFQATIVTLFLSFQQGAEAEPVTLFSVGSGDISGNYYPVAQALCEAFNRSDATRRRCSPEPSTGSIYNLEALRNEFLEFAIVQSDWKIAAYNGTGPFAYQPAMSELRVVAQLFPETVTILASPTSNILSAQDLLGKTVDIGRPASGRNATVKHMLQALDFSIDEFGAAQELRPAAAVEELCDGTIDATILVVGHPSALVEDAVTRCGARLISFDGPKIRELIDRGDTYQKASIDLGMYGRQGEKVPSMSVIATLVTRTTTDDQLVEDFFSAIETNATKLAQNVPVLKELPYYLERNLLSGVPFHPLALDGQ